VLTQNTAWTNVEKAIVNLQQHKALSAEAILDLADEKLATLIRPSGYFNVKAKRLKAMCLWLLQTGGIEKLEKIETRTLREMLLSVHGIGPETADDIMLYAFKRPVFVIDAYTRRLFSRTGSINGDEEYEELRKQFEVALDYQVSDMNELHALIVIHAKQFCRKKPACGECPISSSCDYCNNPEVK